MGKNFCPRFIVFLVVTYAAAAPSSSDIVGWGNQAFGALGALTRISAGLNDSLGLRSDGSIVAWGDNTYGQCSVPIPNSGFVAIAAGSMHSLGMKSDGTIVA